MNLRELEAVRASLVASLAAVDVLIARASESSSPTEGPVTLADAVRVFGSKRRARAFFNRAEHSGFKVVRVGHTVTMDCAEWARALEALGTKRSAANAAAPRASSDSDNESPAALLSGAGLSATRTRGPRSKRAA